MIDLRPETDALASWPTAERLRALQRIIPRAGVAEVLAQTGHDRVVCRRLPGWFMVWFVIALGLGCGDGYRQIFRWWQPFRPGAVPGRSTWCEARRWLGRGPLRRLAEVVIQWLGQPDTPGAFDRGMRLMALDGFVLEVADPEANERAFSRPGSGRTGHDHRFGHYLMQRLKRGFATGGRGRFRAGRAGIGTWFSNHSNRSAGLLPKKRSAGVVRSGRRIK